MWALPIKAVASSVSNAEVLAFGTPKKKKKKKKAIMRCVKCQIVLAFATIGCYVWNGTEGMPFLFYSSSSLFSNKISHIFFISTTCSLS